MAGITMDGKTYRVRIVHDTLVRSFELRNGPNAGYMVSGLHERDLLGTGYTYKLAVEPDPAHPADYDDFFDALSAPVSSHSVTLPFGQTTLQFDAEVQSGEDTLWGKIGGVNRWHGLVVTYRPLALQRKPT